MKTSPAARTLLKVRTALICLALIGMAGIAWMSGESLAARFGQGAVPQSQVAQPPSMNLGELIASAGALRSSWPR